MKILNSNIKDLDIIFSLFDSAIAYQKAKGYELWPQFDRAMIEKEIHEQRNWKIVKDDAIACIFSVMYSDPVIWPLEKNSEPAVYLRRITINPSFKGQNMMEKVKQWAVEHAQHKKKRFVRMDTWGNNITLRNYYISCGFNYLGQRYLENTKGLPAHYGGDVLSLFEIEV
jgi:predicted GNAT family N-acyltransferase